MFNIYYLKALAEFTYWFSVWFILPSILIAMAIKKLIGNPFEKWEMEEEANGK